MATDSSSFFAGASPQSPTKPSTTTLLPLSSMNTNIPTVTCKRKFEQQSSTTKKENIFSAKPTFSKTPSFVGERDESHTSATKMTFFQTGTSGLATKPTSFLDNTIKENNGVHDRLTSYQSSKSTLPALINEGDKHSSKSEQENNSTSTIENTTMPQRTYISTNNNNTLIPVQTISNPFLQNLTSSKGRHISELKPKSTSLLSLNKDGESIPVEEVEYTMPSHIGKKRKISIPQQQQQQQQQPSKKKHKKQNDAWRKKVPGQRLMENKNAAEGLKAVFNNNIKEE